MLSCRNVSVSVVLTSKHKTYSHAVIHRPQLQEYSITQSFLKGHFKTFLRIYCRLVHPSHNRAVDVFLGKTTEHSFVVLSFYFQIGYALCDARYFPYNCFAFMLLKI